jgi:hypothetical protein
MKNSNRNIRTFLIVMLTEMLTSCGPSRFAWDKNTAAEISEKSSARPGHILLLNGDTLSGFFIAVREDSTRWLAASDAQMKSIPTAIIGNVELSSPTILT